MNLIDGSLFKIIDKEAEEKRAAVTIPGRLVPRGRKRVAYRKMVTGLVYLGLFVVFGGQYNFSIATQDSFVQRSLFYRYVLVTHKCPSLMDFPAELVSTKSAVSSSAPNITLYGPSLRYVQHITLPIAHLTSAA